MTNKRSDKLPWSNGTVLVMGDSTVNGIQEKFIGPRFKVRAFPGSIVHDFYNYAITLLEKRLSYVILMAGTNDLINKSSQEILVEMLQLRTFIESNCPDCKVAISCPTDRFDAAKAKLTVMQFRTKVKNSDSIK